MILVTGSAGHLGEAILRLGRARNIPMTGLDRVPSPFTDHVADVADIDAVTHAMAGVTGIIHTATLHKPHVATHSVQAFVDTNISGTLTLLQAATTAHVSAFVFTSTTSTFGRALSPPPGAPAAWIDETVRPVPKNIYGATKTGAEDLCQLYANTRNLPCVVLRTSRFFPEPDDDPVKRQAFPDDNAKANEYLFRRVDIQDAALAHLDALTHAPALGFGRYIISAPSPFQPADLLGLRHDPRAVTAQYFPDMPAIYDQLGWRMFDQIDRVYDSTAPQRDLDWHPHFTFARVLKQAAQGLPIGSDLARDIGIKGYHGSDYDDGLYPVES